MKRLLVAVLFVSWLSCEPGYESGKTKCSTSGKCPSGMVCSSNNVCVSSSGAGAGGQGAAFCPASTSDSTCTTCDKTNCCQELTNCASNDGCKNLAQCYSNCTTLSCDTSCENSYPTGVTPFTTFARCLDSKCTAECATSGTGGTPGSGGAGVATGGTGATTPAPTGGAGGLPRDAAPPDANRPDGAPDGALARGGTGGSSVHTGGVAGGGTGGSSLCPLSSSDTTCTVCDKQACCNQLYACANDTNCVNLVNCLGPCTTTTCQTACTNTYPTAVTPLNNWTTCLNANCASPCASTGGSGGNAGGSGGAGGCDATSCQQSCCNGNVCALTQSATMCGILGEPCGACGPSGNTVTFIDGRAKGAMTGFGWVALGPQDSITDPTCQGQPITAATSYCLGGIKWSASNAICMSGSIPAVDALNPDYTNNWGLKLGINATLNRDGRLGSFGQTLGQSFASIAIAVTGSPLSGLRATVHRSGDADTLEYCAFLTPGVAIPLTSFNTKCYDIPVDGIALTSADVPKIDVIGVNVPSGSLPITVTNLCITGITFSATATHCAQNPIAGTCNTAGNVYCGGTVCCSSNYPYYCPTNSKCYTTEAGALGACAGATCTVCGNPG